MIMSVIYLVLLTVAVNLLAGKAVAFQSRILLVTPTTPTSTTTTRRTRTTPSKTMLHGFWIFGGDKDKKKDYNSGVVDDIGSRVGGETSSSSTDPSSPCSSSVASMTNVMESMKSFQLSQRVARSAAATLDDLSNTFVEGIAADGKIKVTFNGQSVPVGVQIDENYFKSIVKDGSGGSGGLAKLSSELTKAMKDANIKAASKLDDKMKSLYNDFGFDAS